MSRAKRKIYTVTLARDVVEYAELTVIATSRTNAMLDAQNQLDADENQRPLDHLKWYAEDNPPWDTRVCKAEVVP